ncbi:MAG: T9SS type A sorting domain-containing protein [Bacteroidota bacterium]
MKKNILLPVLIFFVINTQAQEVLKVQNGAAVTLEAGAEMIVLGDITLDNGSILSNSGTITLKQNGGSGTSNFFDNTATAYNYGSGKFVFNSPGGHLIYSNNIFGRIDVNTANIILNSTVTSNKWWLESGKVNTGVYTAIVLGSAATDLEAGPSNTDFSNSWINGNLRRYINPAANDNYQFAVGVSSRHLAAMENLNASPIAGVQYIDAWFGNKPGTDAGLAVTEDGAQYVAVNPGGVWHFVPDNAPSTGKFNLKLFFDGFFDLSDNSFAILQRPDLSSDAAAWKVPDGSSINPVNGAGRLLSDGYSLRNDVSVFGQFGIGQLFGALPVTLTNFNAKRLSKLSVQLNWQTQTESHNKGFGIERRPENETSFTQAGFINSRAINGNSNISLDYTFTDNNSYAGVTYYRLKQTDLDDRAYYSLIKAVNGLNGNSVSVMLWPNPNKGQFSIKIDGNTDNREILVTDLQGKNIRRINITGNQQIDVYGLAAGTYVITIPNAMGLNENFKEKIVVLK